MRQEQFLLPLMTICILAVLAGASGCASVGEPAGQVATQALASSTHEVDRPVFRHELFGVAVPVPSPSEIFALDAEQEQNFFEYFNRPDNRTVDGHLRIRDWLENQLPGFDYDDRTIPIGEALRLGRGNCMSLATLTAALARLTGVRHEHQLVRSTPIFDRQHGTLIESDHVRSRVYGAAPIPAPGQFFLRQPFVTIDYFSNQPGLSAERITEDRFLALYYHNLSSEALLDGDTGRSFWLALAALEFEPAFNPALNVLALVHARLGANDTAEAIYQHALKVNGARVDTLTNYRNLLHRQGQTRQAEALDQQRQTLHDPNPYIWIELAEEALGKGQWLTALDYFRNAAEAAPYLPEAHIGQSIAYERLQRPLAARHARDRAMNLTYDPERKKLFKSKLKSFSLL